MRLEAHDRFGNPIKTEITRAVIFDDLDNPILLALKYGPSMCYVGRVGDQQFANILRMMGIDKTVILDEISPEELNKSAGIVIG